MSSQGYLSEEFDLKDYIEVILKKKKIILSVFLLCVLTASVVNFLTPNVYEISVVIKLNSLEKTFFVLSREIKATIEQGTFDEKIQRSLNINSPKTPFQFRVVSQRDSGVIKVSIKETETKKELGVKIINQLVKELSAHYQERLISEKIFLEREIARISNDVLTRRNTIGFLKEKMNELTKREQTLMRKIEEIESQRKKLLEREDVGIQKGQGLSLIHI